MWDKGREKADYILVFFLYNKELTNNALKDQRNSGLKCWLTINKLELVNDKRLTEATFGVSDND